MKLTQVNLSKPHYLVAIQVDEVMVTKAQSSEIRNSQYCSDNKMFFLYADWGNIKHVGRKIVSLCVDVNEDVEITNEYIHFNKKNVAEKDYIAFNLQAVINIVRMVFRNHHNNAKTKYEREQILLLYQHSIQEIKREFT
jgi:hypothetical protein